MWNIPVSCLLRKIYSHNSPLVNSSFDLTICLANDHWLWIRTNRRNKYSLSDDNTQWPLFLCYLFETVDHGVRNNYSSEKSRIYTWLFVFYFWADVRTMLRDINSTPWDKYNFVIIFPASFPVFSQWIIIRISLES